MIEDKIRSLLDLMDKNNLAELEIEEEGFKLRLRKHEDGQLVRNFEQKAMPVQGGAPAAQPEDTGTYIPSPMVGTFYRTPNPESEPYVSPDDFVEPDTVIGIIEAMKVMNEIKAGKRGVIKKVLVESGSPVEYGQNLFQIEPS